MVLSVWEPALNLAGFLALSKVREPTNGTCLFLMLFHVLLAGSTVGCILFWLMNHLLRLIGADRSLVVP